MRMWSRRMLYGCGKKTGLAALIFILSLVSLSSPVAAQNANGRISGTVKDQTGGAIVGAMVSVIDVARGVTRNLTTDDGGAYLAPNLIPGQYTVKASFMGFQAYERSNIALGVSQDVSIDIVLQPGSQTQTVTITEELPLVNTTSATLGGTLNNNTIVELPLSGRNYQNLLELRPGTVLSIGNDSNGGGPASTNGLRSESSNTYSIEGLHGMDPYTGQSVVNNIGVNGDAASILPVDAVQEFNQQFSSKAEAGFKAGSNVSVGLKSGTNAMHGTAYGYFRDSATDARNYFNPNGIDINASAHTFGGTIGGPIKKDKMFFFLGYEQMHLSVGNPTQIQAFFTDPGMLNCTGSGASYSCAPKTGLFPNLGASVAPDASNHIILSCMALKNAGVAVSPQSLQMLGMNANCELPGGTSGSGQTFAAGQVNPDFFVNHGATDHGAQSLSNTQLTAYYPNNDTLVRALGGVAKLDYAINDKNTMNFFWYDGNGDRKDGLNTQPSNRYRTHFIQYPRMFAGSWTWLPNAAWANAVRLGYSRLSQPNYGMDVEEGLSAKQLGLNTGVDLTTADAANLGLPRQIALNGFYTLGSRQSDLQGPGQAIELTDQISYLRGNHAFRFGGTLIRDKMNETPQQDRKGIFGFGRAPAGAAVASSGLIGFLAGQNALGNTPTNTTFTAGGVTFTTGNTQASQTGLQSATLLYNSPQSITHRNNIAFFLQDDWRILPRLTLNLGIRYDVSTVLHADGNKLSGFDPTLPGGLAQEGSGHHIYNGDHNNFAPRVGFAWDVFGNGKTVIRGSGNITYELLTLRGFLEIGNALGISGNPTGWVNGCSVAANAKDVDIAAGKQLIPSGLLNNCGTATGGTYDVNGNLTSASGLTWTPGTFTTPGGTQQVGSVSWARTDGTIVSNVGGTNIGPVLWDRANPSTTTIFPTSTTLNCSPDIVIRDSAAGASRAGAGCTIASVDPNLRTPYVETYTLGVQHALTNNLVLDVAYVGNHGVKLVDKVNLNQPAAGTGTITIGGVPFAMSSATAQNNCNTLQSANACGNSVSNGPRPLAAKYPWMLDVAQMGNLDTSRYNGLQASLTARNFHGVSAVAGYTWSHAFGFADNNNGGFGIDAYNRRLDYGNAASDLRHRFTLAPTYALPGKPGMGGLLEGWRISGNFKFQTGRPLNTTSTIDFQGTARGTSRWSFSGNPDDFTVSGFNANNGLIRDPALPQYFPGCPDAATSSAVHACASLPTGINPRTGVAFAQADMAVNNSACTSSPNANISTLRAFGCWVSGNGQSVLTPPALGQFGNYPRNLFRGPNFWGMDFSLTKKQKVTERVSAEFKAEVFNFTNHPTFANPAVAIPTSCTVASCSFYQITTTNDVQATNPVLGAGGPRRMQFGVRVEF